MRKSTTVLHRRLKELRERKGLTQGELAKACGVDKTAISHWENGMSSPRASRMASVARALGVNVVELFALQAKAS